MPELPEVETVKCSLAPKVTGRKICAIEVIRNEVIHYPDQQAFVTGLQGKQVLSLARRGKYLILELTEDCRLVVHLRMTGRLLCANKEQALLPHTHLILHLDDNAQLRYSDVRRFGGFWYLTKDTLTKCPGLEKLGVEPLSSDFSADYLRKTLGKSRSAIKNALMNQQVIAGLGNIYADESLFRAGIHPLSPCHKLKEAQWQGLVEGVRFILTQAIERKGTTFSDFLDGEGKKGENAAFLQAYGREGEPCPRCGERMQKIRVGGRGTCFCPHCQKLGEE